VVGLSGGIDSALTFAIACDALGPERVLGVTMPGPFSSAQTRADAARVAQNFGAELLELPISDVFRAYREVLAEPFSGLPAGLAEENLQARIRGNLLMAISNKLGHLVLTTGNKSEMACGYATLYGDMAGGFAVLKDVPKTLVWQLARHRNRGGEMIPVSTIERAPSAELRENQKDTDSLPPYDVLDQILQLYVEEDRSVTEIVERGFDAETVQRVVRMVDTSEYKRRQAPPGVKISPKAFGRDRRLPITNGFREW
jgi:NAD+ synthase (glutamine-hydrolysing)